MARNLDPDIAQALAPAAALLSALPRPELGDVETRRENLEALVALFEDRVVEGVETSDHTVRAIDGNDVPMRLYVPEGSRGGALVLCIHGGGMIMGSVDSHEPMMRRLAFDSGVALLAVDYRLAPENPHPAPVEDCYSALQWASDHAASLGFDASRLAVLGDSAGGGLAAATTLLARDRGGPQVTRQILLYPMLDDRNTVEPPFLPDVVTWGYEDNATGWGALLGDAAGTANVSPYAAPARASDLSRLPPTYIMVGDLDIFLREDVDFALRLSAAGVPIELHVHPNACHSFEVIAPTSAVGRRAYQDQLRVMRSL